MGTDENTSMLGIPLTSDIDVNDVESPCIDIKKERRKLRISRKYIEHCGIVYTSVEYYEKRTLY